MAGKAPQIHQMTTDETRNISVDLSALLAGDETLTGSPTVQSPAGVTIDNRQVNTAIVDINNSQVAIGKAVLFRVSEASRGSYDIDVLCSTTGDQVIEGTIRLNVVRSTQ